MKRMSALHSAGTGVVSFIQRGAAVLTALWSVVTSYVPKTYMIVLAKCCTSSKKSYLFLNFFSFEKEVQTLFSVCLNDEKERESTFTSRIL